MDKSTKFLEAVLRYFIYAAAFVPLIIFSQYISPFHFGKVIVFRSMVEIMLVLYLFLIWRDRSFLPRLNKVFWSFFVFTAAFGIATATSVIPYQSFWGTLERMGGFFTFAHYLVFFIILTSVLQKREHWFRLLDFVIFAGILSAFYGFGQKTDMKFFIGSGGRARIFGTMGNAALFAGYQILCLFLAMTLYANSVQRNWRKRFYGFAVAITTLAVLMTAVRGSVLAIMVGFFLFTLLYATLFKSQKARLAILGICTFAVLFVGFALAFKKTSLVQNSSYLTRITDFSPQTLTVQTRFWAWKAGLQGWKETPKTILLGWGPENFNIPFSKHFNPEFYRGPGAETLFDRAHNMFVEILVTMGLFGFLAYIFIFIIVLVRLWRLASRNPEYKIFSVGFIPLIFAYMIHNSFIFDTSGNFITFFIVLGFISILPFEHPANGINRSRGKPVSSGLTNLAVIAAIIIVPTFIYQINILPAKANYTTTRAIVRSWSKDFNGAMTKYTEALSYDVPGKYDYRHRLAQYMLDVNSGKTVSPDMEKVIKYTISEVQKNADENPRDYLPYLYMARLNVILGANSPQSPYNDESLKNSMKALEISPTFVRTYYEVAQAYLNKKQNDKALEYFTKALKLNPDVGITLWYVGSVEIDMGRTKEGLQHVDEALKNGFGVTRNDYLRLITIYVKLGNFSKIAEYYEKIVGLEPDVAQYRASLAVAYVKIGKIPEAIEQAKKAAELDPTFEAEARAFVQSLGKQW